MAKAKPSGAKRGTSKKPASRTTAKVKSLNKKASPKGAELKGSTKKEAVKRATSKRAAKPRLRSLAAWKVVCSKEGILERGLKRGEAAKKSKAHEIDTGHPTTFTSKQE